MNLVTSMCELTSRKILEQAQEIDALYDTVVKAVEDIGEGRTQHIPSSPLPFPPSSPLPLQLAPHHPAGAPISCTEDALLSLFHVPCLRSGQRAASKGGRGIRVFACFHACLPLCCITSPPLSPLVHGLAISSAVSIPVDAKSDAFVLFMDLCALVIKDPVLPLKPTNTMPSHSAIGHGWPGSKSFVFHSQLMRIVRAVWFPTQGSKESTNKHITDTVKELLKIHCHSVTDGFVHQSGPRNPDYGVGTRPYLEPSNVRRRSNTFK